MSKTAQHNFVLKKSIPIIYEDESLCIVNKPSGIAVQGGAGVSVSLIDVLEKQLKTAIFPVHRLDKQTAGLLIIAKNTAAARNCRQLFDKHQVEKHYTALCFGECTKTTEQTIKTPIREHGTEKKALTNYRLITGTNEYSLFSVKLDTGRMHQIRIHLAGIDYPIIGDDKYGNFAQNKSVWKNHRIKKLQLCANKLILPVNGKKRTFSIELPEHMIIAVEKLISVNINEYNV